MKENYTHINVILDRSGSMGQIKQSTIDGYNEFLDEQRKLNKGTVKISLYQFNAATHACYEGIDIENVEPLTSCEFEPRGNTALYDAMGKVIDSTGEYIATLPEEERPDKVLCVIITDGYENASRKYSQSDILTRVTRQRESYNWDFLFLGANQDAILTASHLGIGRDTTMSYETSHAGVTNTFRSTARTINRGRLDGFTGQSLGYTEQDRKEAVEE